MRSVTEALQTLQAWKKASADIRVHFSGANGVSVRFIGAIWDVSEGDIDLHGPNELMAQFPFEGAKFGEVGSKGLEVEFPDGSRLLLSSD